MQQKWISVQNGRSEENTEIHLYFIGDWGDSQAKPILTLGILESFGGFQFASNRRHTWRRMDSHDLDTCLVTME